MSNSISDVCSSIDPKLGEDLFAFLKARPPATCAEVWATLAYVIAQLIRDNADDEDRMPIAVQLCNTILYMTHELEKAPLEH